MAIYFFLKTTQLNFESSFKEFLSCKINFKEHNKLVIWYIYRNPIYPSEILLNLNNMLKAICGFRFSHLLILGVFKFKDVNLSFFESTENKIHMSSILFEDIKDCFISQQVCKPTRSSNLYRLVCRSLIRCEYVNWPAWPDLHSVDLAVRNPSQNN